MAKKSKNYMIIGICSFHHQQVAKLLTPVQAIANNLRKLLPL